MKLRVGSSDSKFHSSCSVRFLQLSQGSGPSWFEINERIGEESHGGLVAIERCGKKSITRMQTVRATPTPGELAVQLSRTHRNVALGVPFSGWIAIRSWGGYFLVAMMQEENANDIRLPEVVGAGNWYRQPRVDPNVGVCTTRVSVQS